MCDLPSDKFTSETDKVCRDFIRNVCTRKSKCRFKHPAHTANIAQNAFNPDEERQKFCKAFCHDYQVRIYVNAIWFPSV